MSWRLVQRGEGPVVALWLVGSQVDPDLRAALPGRTIVATSRPALDVATLSAALRVAGADAGSPVVAVGYSAGCQAVRSLLVAAGPRPVGVVAIDGTHASKPPAPWQINAWREVADRARRAEMLVVATCTLQRYVERLPSGAYLATSTVLAQVLGAPELGALPVSPRPLAAYPGEPVWHLEQGALFVEAYQSTDCDHDAHVAQQRDVLPSVLRRFVAPYMAARWPVLAPPAASSPGGHVLPAHPWRDPAISLGERCVLWSLAEMARPDAEERPTGSNGGPYVAALLAPCERAGKLLGITSGNYCAAGASAALKACLLPGELAPHGYRAAVVELVADAGPERWVSAAQLRAGWRLEVGDLLVWDRSVPGRPETAWQRHVGRVRVASSGPVVQTVEANAGTGRAWHLLDRRLDDPRLLGAITYPGREQPEPTTAGEIDVREAARLVALSDAVWAGAAGLPDLDAIG